MACRLKKKNKAIPLSLRSFGMERLTALILIRRYLEDEEKLPDLRNGLHFEIPWNSAPPLHRPPTPLMIFQQHFHHPYISTDSIQSVQDFRQFGDYRRNPLNIISSLNSWYSKEEIRMKGMSEVNLVKKASRASIIIEKISRSFFDKNDLFYT